MTLQEYLSIVQEYHARYHPCRLGQAFFNCLPDDVTSEFVKRYPLFDPYHRDDLIPKFMAILLQEFVYDGKLMAVKPE